MGGHGLGHLGLGSGGVRRGGVKVVVCGMRHGR